jgi:hypothetical protein
MVENFAKLIIDADDSAIVRFAKMQVNGFGTGLEKHDYITALQKRANDVYPDRLTPQQKFARCMCDDGIGQLLYKAMKAAPGSEVKPAEDAVEDNTRPMSEAEARLHSMAVDHALAHAPMSYQQAYAYLYAHDDNRALRNKIRNEHLSRAMAATHGP